MKYLPLIFTFIIPMLLTACAGDDGIDLPDDPDNPENYHLQNVGDSAEDLLQQDKYKSLTVEVVYVSGYEPTVETINNLTSFLQQRLYKPGGISVSKKEISSPDLAPYSITDLQEVEDNHRSTFNDGNQLTAYAFFADGNFAESDNVLGVAYRNTSVALFAKRIDELSGGLGQPSSTLLESTVTHHEFGHMMGLVNVGTPPQSDHQDEAHGKHCDVEECLMYYTAETGDVVSNLVGLGSVPELDSQCIADLQANGGK